MDNLLKLHSQFPRQQTLELDQGGMDSLAFEWNHASTKSWWGSGVSDSTCPRFGGDFPGVRNFGGGGFSPHDL